MKIAKEIKMVERKGSAFAKRLALQLCYPLPAVAR